MLNIVKTLVITASLWTNFAFASVLVVPIIGPIDHTEECIVRRALKQAQRNSITTVLFDIETPGGSVSNMLGIIDMIQKAKLHTIAYINPEAISAGSFIANVCDEIYFHPKGIMGAAAVINSDGKNLDKNLQAKIDSYLWAKIRAYTEKFPHRYEIQRAMMDRDFVLKSGKTIIKPAGELLTLTATEALKSYSGLPALSNGTFENIDDLVKEVTKQDSYRTFRLTGFEKISQLIEPFIPILSGIGLFLLFLEFKTPGFGLMGILGIGCFCLSFLAQYIAGFGGLEAFFLFFLGIAFTFLDLFFFGTMLLALLGIVCIGVGILWSGLDIWPNIPLSLSDLMAPLSSLGYSLLVLIVLFLIAWRLGLLKAGLNYLTLKASIKETKTVESLAGKSAETITALMPSGKIKYGDRVLEAQAVQGNIKPHTPVKIIRKKDFVWLVEEQGKE